MMSRGTTDTSPSKTASATLRLLGLILLVGGTWAVWAVFDGQPGSLIDDRDLLRKPLTNLDRIERGAREADDEQRARDYADIERISELRPTRGRTQVRAGEVWMRYGETDRALEAFRRAFWSQQVPQNRLLWLARVLQPDGEALASFMLDDADESLQARLAGQLFWAGSRGGDWPLMKATLDRMEPSDETFRRHYANYIDRAIRENRPEAAIATWQRYLGEPIDSVDTLFNGDFERDLTEIGLGWRVRDFEGVRVARVDRRRDRGNKALRIRFEADDNINYHHVWIHTPLSGGGRYRLTGQWMGTDVTTRDTPYIELYTQGGEKRQWARSDRPRGTWPWEAFSVDIDVPDDAGFLTLRVRRPKTRALDKFLTGTLWLDDLKLERVADE